MFAHAWWSSTSPVASSYQAVQARRIRNRAQSSPALRCVVYETPVIAPAPKHRVVLSTPQTFGPYTPHHARRQARQNHPAFPVRDSTHILRIQLPTLTSVSHRFCTAAQLVLYCTLEHTATAPAPTNACIASLAVGRARDVTHDPDVPAVRTWPVLQPRPPLRGVVDVRPRDAHAGRVRR